MGKNREEMVENKDQVGEGGGHHRKRVGARRRDGGKGPSTVMFVPWTAHCTYSAGWNAEGRGGQAGCSDRLAALTGFSRVS